MTDNISDQIEATKINASSPPNHQKKPLHVAIIGSGSAAFACAIKAAAQGATVTIIEAGTLGGCCVNVGCIPSKIMIRSAQFAQQQRNNPFCGLTNQPPIIDRELLVQQQQSQVEQLRTAKYQQILARNPALTLINGRAKFKNSTTLTITHADDNRSELTADRILIATGAQPYIPNIEGINSVPYWTSTQAIFAASLPKHLVVIGSSVVAVELAQAYQQLGTQVTLLARHSLLSKQDPALGAGLQQALEAQGMVVKTQTQAQAVTFSDGTFELLLNNGRLTCDKLLIAAGRQPNTAPLALEKAGVTTNQQQAIFADAQLKTNVEHIYAAGDSSTLPQYVYVAASAGTRAAINMTGGQASLELSTMPAVIFTEPQVATVGLTETQAAHMGIATTSRQLNLNQVPRAIVNFDTQGFIKLVINSDNQQLIGAQILAHNGGEIIQTAALAIVNNMTISALAQQLFPYLTMAEGLKLCAQTFNQDVSQLSCCAG